MLTPVKPKVKFEISLDVQLTAGIFSPLNRKSLVCRVSNLLVTAAAAACEVCMHNRTIGAIKGKRIVGIELKPYFGGAFKGLKEMRGC